MSEIKAWNGKDEVENIAELEDRGYREGYKLCPECGTVTMESYTLIDDDSGVEEVSARCPYCGWWDLYYE